MNNILRYRNKKSFSLIEVIVAIVFLETIAVSLMGMLTFGNRAALINEDNLSAVNLMQWKVEEIKCRSFATNVTASGVFYPGFNKFTFNISQITPYASNIYLKRISVAETWTNPLGVAKTETVVFLVANY